MQKPVNDHLFESGVLEQENILNVQDRGSPRTSVEDLWSKVSNDPQIAMNYQPHDFFGLVQSSRWQR